MKKLLLAIIVLASSAAMAAHTYVPKRSWVQLAAIAYQDAIPPAGYSGDGTVLYSKLGYYDMIIGTGGTVKSQFRSQNPGGALISYNKASSVYSPLSTFNQLPEVAAWSATQGDVAPWDILLTPTATVIMKTKASNGSIHYDTTTSGNYLRYFFWNDSRYGLNFFEPKMLGWYAYRFRTVISTDADGVMEDEALGGQNGQGYVSMPGSFPIPQTGDNQLYSGSYTDLGYPLSTYRPMADSATRFLLNDFYPKWSDTLYNNNWMHFKNYAAYLYATDSSNHYDPSHVGGAFAAYNSPNDQWNQAFVNHRNINFLMGEYSGLFCNGYTRHWQYMNYVQTLVDSGCKAVLWCGPQYNAFLSQYDIEIAQYGKQKAFRTMYAYYLMSAHPTLTWWLITSNQAETKLFPCDTILQRGITEYNIGQPSGHFIDSSSTAAPDHYYIKTKRYYTNAVVLYQNQGNPAWNYNLAADTSRFHCTGFYTLQDDGTLSATTTLTASLAAGPDGLIMIPNVSGPATTGTIQINDATVTEGGTLTFTVTLSQAQAGATTFNWSIGLGTATPGASCSGSTDYLNVSGNKTIAAGQLTTTISVPTCDDATYEIPEYLYVNLTSISPSTLVLQDVQGLGTINDNDNPTAPQVIRSYLTGKFGLAGKFVYP